MSSVYEIIESSVSALRESHSLFVKNHEEAATNKELMVLKPDWNRYLDIEAVGKLLVLVAYADGAIVGYSLNVIDSNIHYADLVVCNNTVLFVLPEHRASPLGLRLMKRTREHAKAYGAAVVVWHAKEHSSLSKLLSRKRIKVEEIIYSEPL